MIDIASVTIGFVLLLGAMTLGLHIATVMFGVGFIGAHLAAKIHHVGKHDRGQLAGFGRCCS